MLRLERLEARCLLSSVTLNPGGFGAWVPDTVGFGEVGVGQPKEIGNALTITNNSGDDVRISNITVSNPVFSYEEPLPATSLPFSFRADEVIVLPPNSRRTEVLEGVAGTWSDHLYSVEATRDEHLSLRVQVNDASGLYTGVFTNGGTLLASDIVTLSAPGVEDFLAGYTGTYYVHVYGVSAENGGSYDIEVAAAAGAPDITVPSAIDGETTYNGRLTDSTLAPFHPFLLSLSGGLGDQVSLTPMIGDITASLSVFIYDRYGSYIAGASAGGSASFEFGYTGIYYLAVNGSYAAGSLAYQVMVHNDGSSLLLGDGEAVTLPLWCRPTAPGAVSGTLTVGVDTGRTTSALSLTATGKKPDPKPTALDLIDPVGLPALVTGAIQAEAGRPLEFTLTAWNAASSDLISSAEVRVLLSRDQTPDAGDTVLEAGNLAIPPLFAEETVQLAGQVQLPQSASGQYYLLAVVDPDNELEEASEIAFPPGDFVASSGFLVSAGDVLALDSVGDAYDRVMNYGERPIGSINMQYVYLVNRGTQTATVTGLTLASGASFRLPAEGSPLHQDTPVAIPAGQYASFAALFTPQGFTTEGNPLRTDTLQITTDQAQTFTIALSGRLSGATLAVLESSGAANDDRMELGEVRVGRTSTQTMTLVNYGNTQLKVSSIVAALNPSPFSTNLPAGGLTLAPGGTPGASATVAVSFSPTTSGEVDDTLVITSNNPLGTYAVAVEGTGIAPALVVEDSLGLPTDEFLPFDWQPVGSPTDATVTLRNEGTDVLTITGWRLTTGAPEAFVVAPTNDPGSGLDDVRLDPGKSTELTITFLAGQGGAFSDTLTIYSDDADVTVNLQSIAGLSAPPGYVVGRLGDPTGGLTLGLDLNDVFLGTEASQTFQLWNNGRVDLRLYSLTVEGEGYSLVAPDLPALPATLAAGAAPLIRVVFDADPARGTGDFNGTIIFASSAADEATVTLTATVVTPQASLSASQVDFGTVDQASQIASKPVVISNQGTGALVIRQWVFDDAQFQFEAPAGNVVNGQLIVAPGSVATGTINYTPTAPGARQATLTLLTNDLDDPTLTVSVSARNLGQPCIISAGVPCHFRDADGDLVRVLLSDGQGRLYLTNGQLTGADIDQLILEQTSARSRLIIESRGGGTSARQIVVNEGLDRLLAGRLSVRESVQMGGSVNQMELGDMADGATMVVAAGGGAAASFKGGVLGENVALTFGGELASFQAAAWGGGSLAAREIGRLRITKGGLGADVSTSTGDIEEITVQTDLSGDVQAAGRIGRVRSRAGAITGDVIAETGGIERLEANGDIGVGEGTWIFARGEIGRILSRRGALSATVRGGAIGQVAARELDRAVLSSAGDIGGVTINQDISDSFLLAGYDIGRNGLIDTSDDTLSAGHAAVRFGGQFDGSYVTAGVITEGIYAQLGLTPPAPPLPSATVGTIKAQGGQVRTEVGGTEFGLYAAQGIQTNLTARDNFVIVPNL